MSKMVGCPSIVYILCILAFVRVATPRGSSIKFLMDQQAKKFLTARLQSVNIIHKMVDTLEYNEQHYKGGDSDRYYGCIEEYIRIAVFLETQPMLEQSLQDEIRNDHIKPFLPAQPALVKFYNVAFGGEMPEKKCCGILCQPKRKMYNKAGGAKLTMEKAGMCGNCAQFGPTNCWVCFSVCQSEAWMHSGDIPSTYSPQGCACFKSKTNQITKSHCVQVVCSY